MANELFTDIPFGRIEVDGERLAFTHTTKSSQFQNGAVGVHDKAAGRVTAMSEGLKWLEAYNPTQSKQKRTQQQVME